MKRYLLYKTGKILKLIIICSVILYITLFLIKTPLTAARNQYDIRAAILISVGFAASFRAMLCCRKKV